MRYWPLLLLPATISANASETDWRGAWDGTLYAYTTATDLTEGSQLNPDNQIAELAEHLTTGEARFNLKAENGIWRITARPILLLQDKPGSSVLRKNDAYLSQWQVHLRIAQAWSLSAGREVLNWGPAQFRSPSSPFYFDNGRSNPLFELSGLDRLKLSWTPNMNTTLTTAYLEDSGHDAGQTDDAWRDGWLEKWDQRGEDWTLGLTLAQADGRRPFIGAHGQWGIGPAVMLYAEAASGTDANKLVSPADPGLPFILQTESSRRTDWLLGGAYAFDSGSSINLEYLHYGHGYTENESAAYFARAATAPMAAALALSAAPPLLNRNYLHLVWQSNLMEQTGYARLMFTRNLDDGSNELAGYGEHKLSTRITGFALGIYNTGGEQREFASLMNRRILLGVKIVLP